MLRWRGDESLEIYARVNDADWADWTQKMVNVAVDSTIASRLTYMDFSVETRQRFTDIAEAMLSMNAGTARAATAQNRTRCSEPRVRAAAVHGGPSAVAQPPRERSAGHERPLQQLVAPPAGARRLARRP